MIQFFENLRAKNGKEVGHTVDFAMAVLFGNLVTLAGRCACLSHKIEHGLLIQASIGHQVRCTLHAALFLIVVEGQRCGFDVQGQRFGRSYFRPPSRFRCPAGCRALGQYIGRLSWLCRLCGAMVGRVAWLVGAMDRLW